MYLKVYFLSYLIKVPHDSGETKNKKRQSAVSLGESLEDCSHLYIIVCLEYFYSFS